MSSLASHRHDLDARRLTRAWIRRGSRLVLLASVLSGARGTASGQVAATPPAITTDTVVLLPDTQYYSDYDIATFFAQTDWIAGLDPNLAKMVIHLGDITNNDAPIEYARAKAAMSVLRTGPVEFPYVMVPGNHDNPDSGARRDTTNFNDAFGIDHFTGRSYPWQSMDGVKSDNSFATFAAGGRQFLVLNLEYAPRKNALCWANDVIQEHPNHAVILATHCYQAKGGGFQDCTTSKNLIGSNGETIWLELARRHTNVRMIVSGHITGSAMTRRDRVTSAQVPVAEGDTVAPGQILEVLTDFQFVREPALGRKHGMGWMRTLSFPAGSDQVTLNSFSVLDAEQAGAQLEAFFQIEPDAFPNGEYHRSRTFTLPRALPPYSFDPVLLNVHDFNVNDGASGDQLHPRIAGNGAAPVSVVWGDDFNQNGVLEVKGRGFRPDGCEARDQQTINQVPAGHQRRPAIAVGQNGSTVVVWEDDSNENGVFQIHAAGFDAQGQRTFPGGEITVNQVEEGEQLRPDVAMDSAGNFVVVWQDDSNENGVFEIKGARFGPTGARMGDDFTVNAGSAGNQLEPRLAMRRSPGTTDDGAFVVVWEDDLNENGVFQVKAARYSPPGVKLTWPGQGGETDRTINQFPEGQQRRPALALHENGELVIVWQDDRNENGVFQVKMAGFDALGNKKVWGPGGEEDQTVNQGPGGDQINPKVSVNRDRRFVVVWQDDLNENGLFQIKAAGFDLDGQRSFDDATVNFNPNGDQVLPDVHLSNDNQVFVVWQDDVNVNGFQEIVGKAWVFGQPIEPPASPSEMPPPQFAEMEGPPWFAIQGSIEADASRHTIGARSISFAPGFTEARPPGFQTGEFPAIGSKLLVDVFVPSQQPASNYKGAVQLYWGIPGAGLNHQFAGQKELSPLGGGAWHTLEFELPDPMRRLFLESHANAELTFAVNTDPAAPARTLLDNLRLGGVLIPHSTTECTSAACLSVCGPGKDSCDGNSSNGCETYLATSRNHCGACGRDCGTGLCVNGSCEPPGARTINANLSITSQWDTGYCAALGFTNQSLAPVAWEIIVNLRDSTITTSWNGTFSGQAGVVSVSGVNWNQVIQPGASLHSLGFCAQRPSGTNTAVVLRTNTQFQ